MDNSLHLIVYECNQNKEMSNKNSKRDRHNYNLKSVTKIKTSK